MRLDASLDPVVLVGLPLARRRSPGHSLAGFMIHLIPPAQARYRLRWPFRPRRARVDKGLVETGDYIPLVSLLQLPLQLDKALLLLA